MQGRLRLPALPKGLASLTGRLPKMPQALVAMRGRLLPVLKEPRTRIGAAVVAVLVVAAVILAGAQSGTSGRPRTPEGGGPHPPDVVWGETINLNAVGYEPGIAADSTGALYITAHKNLDNKGTWPYLASWFLVSTDEGATWRSPNQPPLIGNYWKTYLGDEGDIAVDGNDMVYFLDTYLIDNHIHVFRDQGVWDHSVRIQKTTGLDDRPWLTAQGAGILHYLGNNGGEVQGGRYWYYRSMNEGRTWTAGDPVPGNGWGEIDAERDGQHVYISSEGDVGVPADILVYVSENSGRTWDWSNPTVVAHRDGPGRAFPIVSSGVGGMVYILWNDASNATENGTRIFLSASDDFGKTWNTTEITPFEGFLDYPTMQAGPDGSVAVAFYGTRDLPVSANSSWYLYGAMQRNASFGNIRLNFSKASEEPLYIGDDLHALHDFFEIVITPDGALNIGFQHYDGPCNGCSSLYFVRGTLPTTRPQG